jgi:hypothetical protein
MERKKEGREGGRLTDRREEGRTIFLFLGS